MNRKYDLEERLINFACNCIDVSEGLPQTFAAKHIASHMVRSSTSPALNYGEAQGAESINDFIHKMRICLKELRETKCCLALINKKKWYDEMRLLGNLKENNELISIFVASIQTAQKNKK
jgi:four helix bundle protein